MTANHTTPSVAFGRLSAVTGRKSGAERFAPIPQARIAGIFEDSRRPRLKFLDRLAAEHNVGEKARAVRLSAAAELYGVVAALKAKAEIEQWSARELAQRSGFSWRTWGRICMGTVDSVKWLPKVRAAAARLQENSTVQTLI